MPDANLTRAEARARSAQVSAVSYDVEVDLRRAPTDDPTFPSTTRLRFRAAHAGMTWVDLLADSVSSVELNGQALPRSSFDGARITFSPRPGENELRVVAACQYSTTGEGLHRLVDPVDSQTYLYTQFATAEARRMFACFEQPDLKAPMTLVVSAPAGWVVISTQDPAAVVALDPTAQRWEFPPAPPLSTYVMSLIAGPYQVVVDSHRGRAAEIPLRLYTRASMAQHLDAAEILEVTRAGLAFYEDAFAMAHPFAKYDQIFVPEFNLGAMENPGAVTFREQAFLFRSRVTRAAREQRATVILHEMAHMWFGDLVTMAWWDDLWLNESFATWCGHHVATAVTDFDQSWISFALSSKAWAARADQLPSSHPVSADMVDLEAVYLNFDGITYAKGAAVLRQLVAWVGLEAFLAGVRTYFADHAWGNTTLSDLLAALEVASGRDLQGWAAAWLQTAGMNTLTVSAEPAADGTYRRVSLHQLPARLPVGAPPLLRPHRVAVGAYRWHGDPGRGGVLQRDACLELDLVGERAEVADLAGQPVAPLLLPNDGDLTFARIRLDPGSLQVALAHVSAIADPLARALVWGCAWDMVRDAELPAARYLQMVVGQVGAEPSDTILEAVLATLPEALTAYLPAARMVAAVAEVADAALGWTRVAPPGSDRQLACARAFLRWARTPDQLAVVSDALADPTGRPAGLPGVEMDRDLRWAGLTRLVALGAGDADAVAAELVRDDTTAGRQAAALALAARPDPQAKAAAWAQALAAVGLAVPGSGIDPGSSAVGNALLEATLRGWAYPEQADLTAAYVEPYFEVIERAWSCGSPNSAQDLAEGLFPARQVRPDVLSRSQDFLARPDLPAGLARVVAEGADGLARALRARDCQ